jgi:hypothetical protein
MIRYPAGRCVLLIVGKPWRTKHGAISTIHRHLPLYHRVANIACGVSARPAFRRDSERQKTVFPRNYSHPLNRVNGIEHVVRCHSGGRTRNGRCMPSVFSPRPSRIGMLLPLGRMSRVHGGLRTVNTRLIKCRAVHAGHCLNMLREESMEL